MYHTFTTLAFLFILIAPSVSLRAPPDHMRKKLAGPPSEFSNFIIPSPTANSPTDSAVFTILPDKTSSSGWSWTTTFPVDSSTLLSVGIASPNAINLKVTFSAPSAFEVGRNLTVSPDKQINGVFGLSSSANNLIPITSFIFNKPTPGTWTVSVTSSTPSQVNGDVNADGFLVVYNESPFTVLAHLNTDDLEVGRDLGLVARIVDDTVLVDDNELPKPLVGLDINAEMAVMFPGGRKVTLAMSDDGLSADEAANDGIYGAIFEASESGAYFAQSMISGKTPEGRAFIRTTQHTFVVVEPSITLTGLGIAKYDESQQTILFDIDVDVDVQSKHVQDEENGFTVKAYAEVWGTDQSGLEYVPVAWMEAMVDPVPIEQGYKITLQLHKDWLAKAQASAPFQLRNAWLQERNTNVAFSERSAIFIETDSSSFLKFPQFDYSLLPEEIEITGEMKNGPRPRELDALLLESDNNNSQQTTPTTVLVHGYCASANEWPLNQFDNSVHFEDFDKSRSNDGFALQILNFINDNKYSDVRFVGHSQAGPATTHLITFYWSPADNTQTGRLIQTMGSPFQGSGLSSWGSLGSIIGIGCGVNTDLTYDGAAAWLSSIPQEKRAQVYSYITQYGSEGYCVWGANMFLYKPNDGTTEFKKASLPGATTFNPILDWCHTTEMVYPNQCTNSETNAIMNKCARQSC